MKKLALIIAAAALIAIPALQADSATGTTGMQVTVGPEASLTVGTSTTTLATTGSLFNPYTGTTNLTYKVRTTDGTGSGSITAEVTADFSGSGGPSVGTPPNTGDALTFTCSFSASGTGCSSAQTASTSATATAVTFGAGVHSVNTGDAGSVTWSLTNDPKYKTGTYNATVTFTIAAL